MSARLNTFRSQSPSIAMLMPILLGSPSPSASSNPIPIPIPSTDVPIWQLDNLFLKRCGQRQSLRAVKPQPLANTLFHLHSSSSNVSAVFLFSVIVLNQSQKSVIMTALLIVTAHSANCPGPSDDSTIQPSDRDGHSLPKDTPCHT